MTRGRFPLPGWQQLVLLWLAHAATIAILAHKGFLTSQAAVGMVLLAMIAFITGSSVERYRAALQAKLEGDDGSD